MRKSSPIINCLLAIFTTAIIASCGSKAEQPAGGAAGANQPPAQYEVLQLQPRSATIYMDYPATLQGEEVVEIRPKIEGYLEEVYVDEGASVSRGQRLFRISSPQYEQEYRSAEAGIKTAQANVAAAEMTVNKTRPLVEKEIISKYELESAQYTLQARQAALAQANATLANARANVGYTVITSPTNGIMGTIPYKKGSLVSGTSASPLTTISADKDVYAYFAMNEKQLLDFSRNYKGRTLQEKLKQLPPVQLVLADGTAYDQKGRIETASGLLTTETGSSNFRATFPNPNALLRSGGSASVRLPQSVKDGILVPQRSVYELQGKHFVYVVDANNTVKSTEITVQEQTAGQYFVVTSGLKAGDKVVYEGASSLQDNTKIQPAAMDTAKAYQDLQR